MNNISLLYFIRQVLVILMLFATGYIFNKRIIGGLWAELLAFGTGLALWGNIGFCILVFGIPYNLISVAIGYLLIFFVFFFVTSKTGLYVKRHETIVNNRLIFQQILLWIFVLLMAILCTSGAIKIALSNDSYYYYSLYPQAIVHFGKYMTSFDVFMTDVGQTTAIINCLPWMFGFEQTFGIQLFQGFNTLLIFAFGIYRLFSYKGHKVASIIAFISTLYLATCSPYVVMTRWILANAYFMSFLFVIFIIICDMEMFDIQPGILIIEAIYIAMLSMMRMEGGMIAALVTICICSLDKFDNKTILTFFVSPIAFTQFFYYLIVYLKLSINPVYSFLDLKNAAVMIGVVIILFVFVGFIRGKRLLVVQKHLDYCILILLALGNLVLCCMDSEKYIGNIKFFILNIYQKNGWGYFGYQMAVLLIIPIIYFICELIHKKKMSKMNFATLFFVGFAFFIVAVCWARDGSLRIGIGDSGNRVLMQITPFAVYMIMQLLSKTIFRIEED